MATLGIVANAFAVVSLSLQVVEAAFNIKIFFDTISDIPSDVQHLKDVCSQVLTVAHNIRYLGNGEGENNQAAKAMLNSIDISLQVCLNRLRSIEEILVMARHAEKDRPRVSRTRAQIRLACKKQRIQELERQLVHATHILTTNLVLYSVVAKPSSVAAGPLPRLEQGVDEEPYYTPDRIGQYLESISSKAATQPKLSAPSTYKKWTFGRQSSLQRCRLSGERKKYELTLRARASKNRFVVTRLSRPRHIRSLLKVLTISVRNQIPDDAGIMTACKSGDGSRVKHLLGTGLAGPNDMTPANDTPLSMAIKGGFKEVVQFLLNQGADPNITCGKYETSPLQIAVAYEKADIARLLITSGADIEYTSSRGWSVLHHLFEKDRSMLNTEYFSMFMGQTSFDDTKDLEGWTALHRCAAFGTAEDVDFLYRMGALRLPDRYRTNSGRNPIHMAALMNNVSTLKALMQCRTSLPTTNDRSVSNQHAIHFVDAYGFTPLHHAVYGHAKETVVYLLQHGADPRASVRRPSGWHPKNHKGDVLTVEDFARISDGEEFLGTLVEALQGAGHNVTTDGENILWGVR